MVAQDQTLHVSREVGDAIAARRPVVALESTVITHGLPREPRQMSAKFCAAFPEWLPNIPANMAAACALEKAGRAAGGVPATIAVIDGRICVGLAADDMERLARAPKPKKLSVRDLGVAVAKRETGGTTVAATTAIAARAGIGVFATGGLGGVHRGWSGSMDVSSDLFSLSRSRVLVVCAGAKILLDLPATLEILESLGIPTIGFQTEYMPRFTVAPDPSIRLHHAVDSAADVARIAHAHWQLQPSVGMIVMQACPPEFAVDGVSTERHLARALAQADAEQVRGAALTPFLLARLAECEEGPKMVEANLALLMSNARLAAHVATSLCTEPGPSRSAMHSKSASP